MGAISRYVSLHRIGCDWFAGRLQIVDFVLPQLEMEKAFVR